MVAVLNGLAGLYRRELAAAMVARLGVKPVSPDADGQLADLAFRALADGGESPALGAFLL